jgi:hypothetical protein
MREEPPGMDTHERRVGILAERVAVLESFMERMTGMDELLGRLATLEAIVTRITEKALEGKGGVLDRLQHLDECVDGIKKTIWMASGVLSLLILLANWYFGHK